MSGRIPFWVKGTSGLLLFALTPVYCVWSLSEQNKRGTLVKPSKEFFERSFK